MLLGVEAVFERLKGVSDVTSGDPGRLEEAKAFWIVTEVQPLACFLLGRGLSPG